MGGACSLLRGDSVISVPGDIYTPGMKLTVGSDTGAVEEVGAITTRIRTTNGGAIFVPNGKFLETVVRGSEPS